MELKYYDLDLDLVSKTAPAKFTVVEGDTGNVLNITLTNAGAAVNLDGLVVQAVFSSPLGVRLQNGDSGVSVTTAASGEIAIALRPASYSAGIVSSEIQLYGDANLETLVTSARFCFRCKPALCGEQTIYSDAGMPPLVAATEAAIAAVAKIAGISASASTLSAGASPTVTVTNDDTGLSLAFGIPHGAAGEAGQDGSGIGAIVDTVDSTNLDAATTEGVYIYNNGSGEYDDVLLVSCGANGELLQLWASAEEGYLHIRRGTNNNGAVTWQTFSRLQTYSEVASLIAAHNQSETAHSALLASYATQSYVDSAVSAAISDAIGGSY